MPFDRGGRLALLNQRADVYIETALDAITREYPYMPYLIVTGPGPIPTHRELHPTFYGCFDWHSCVEMHWAIVWLLRRFPEAVPVGLAAEAHETLGELLTEENIAAEVWFFEDPNHRSL